MYLNVVFCYVLQHPDTMGPGIIIAGVAAGCLRTHAHLLVKEFCLMRAKVLAASHGFSMAQIALTLLLPTALLCTTLLKELQNHPASEKEDWVQMLE